MNDKVDIVVSWLDNEDTKWQNVFFEEFQKYQKNQGIDTENDQMNPASRFRDFNAFRYWFRGIEKNAPWVNKIYLVTCGHFPKWLNKEHPKLVLVSHEEFIPKKYLPTFSSITIALNLHRIEGLSDKFVYFNDDMYMINPTKTTDFYKGNIPCDSLTLIPAQTHGDFYHFAINDMQLINREFSKNDIVKKNLLKMINPKVGLAYVATTLLQLPYPNISDLLHFHAPTAVNKHIYSEVWEKFFDEMDKACSYKFRNINSASDWVVRRYSLASGNFVPKNIGKFFQFVELNEENIEILETFINKTNKKVLCLNDSLFLPEEKFEKAKETLTKALERKLSEKSSFEL